MIRTMLKLMLILIASVSVSRAAFAVEPTYSDFFGNAIRGYDPVAYFTDGKPLKGDKSFSYEWNESTWLFASAEHRELFVNNPAKYAPQYGGYCAWAVSNGYTAKIDPNAWDIRDGKLYLNYSKSVQSTWHKSVDENIAKADVNWPKLLSE